MSSRDSPRESPVATPDGRPEDRPFRVLLAEDDVELRRLLGWCLRNEGYDVTECRSALELLEHLRSYCSSDAGPDFRLIVSDIRMPGTTGLEALEQASAQDRFPPLILITAFGDAQLEEQAQRLGVIPFSDDPFEIQKLVAKVRAVAPIPVAVSGGS